MGLAHTLALVMTFTVPSPERETRILQLYVAERIPLKSFSGHYASEVQSEPQLQFLGFAPDSSQSSERGFNSPERKS